MAEKYGEIPKDFKGRVGYYWLYYKWHTVAALFVITVLAVGIGQCATKPRPDYTVILYVNKSLPMGYAEVMGEELAKYSEDLNGDGKRIVSVIDTSYNANASDYNISQANSTKLAAELATADTLIFITDDPKFADLKEKTGNGELFGSYSFTPDLDGLAFNLKATPLYEAINTDNFYPKNLYVSVRRTEGLPLKKSEKLHEKARRCAEFVQRITEEKPVE
ncbi:MAG: hypothetical protein LBQ48_01300 [Oscillospiraceae bacterium]|jgi:hypothetical protein|nr:hypothetical protein [Oscillospiraceae bacterium]